MAAYTVVKTTQQLEKELLEIPNSESVPVVRFVDSPDPHRSLKIAVPLDSTHATWVESEETPNFVNATRTKFIIRPPFDAKNPPRFTLYAPYGDSDAVIQKGVSLQSVADIKSLNGKETSIWSVYPITSRLPHPPIARGLMLHQSESSFTLLDIDRNAEVKMSMKKVRLECESAYRPGIGAKSSLLGHSTSSVVSPLGVCYALPNCIHARLTYLFNLRQRKDASGEFPIYMCMLQQQFHIKNESDIRFSRISTLSIASETFTTSEDGYPTRAFSLESDSSRSIQLIRPFLKTHEGMFTLRERGTHIITDDAIRFDTSYAVVTIDEVPLEVGVYSKNSTEIWLPTAELHEAAPQAGVAQLHVKHGPGGFDSITAATRWQRHEDQADVSVPWSRIRFSDTATRINTQCIVRQSHQGVDYVNISAVNYFTRPMLLAFEVHPGTLGKCSQIEATSGARPLVDYPWKTSTRGTTYQVFVVNNQQIPISFRGTIITSK